MHCFVAGRDLDLNQTQGSVSKLTLYCKSHRWLHSVTVIILLRDESAVYVACHVVY